MSLIYIEDFESKVENKYLAVNVIAKRARQLNIEAEKFPTRRTGKTVSQAMGELLEGTLSYEMQLETQADSVEVIAFPIKMAESSTEEISSSDDDEGGDLAKKPISPRMLLTVNSNDDEEPEEGL